MAVFALVLTVPGMLIGMTLAAIGIHLRRTGLALAGTGLAGAMLAMSIGALVRPGY